MKVKALRGVCIGPGRHLAPGDVAELDAATYQFLSHIRAVEQVIDAPAVEETPKEKSTPAKSGKEK